MVQKIVRFKCEICKTEYLTKLEAHKCESFGKPEQRFNVGDTHQIIVQLDDGSEEVGSYTILGVSVHLRGGMHKLTYKVKQVMPWHTRIVNLSESTLQERISHGEMIDSD